MPQLVQAAATFVYNAVNAALIQAGASATTAYYAGQAAAAVAQIGLVTGASVAANKLFGPEAPSLNSRGVETTTAGGVEPHRIVYGRQMVAGHVVAEHAWNRDGVSDGKFDRYARVIVIAGHEIEEVEALIVDGTRVDLSTDIDGSGNVTLEAFEATEAVALGAGSALRVSWGLGTRDQAADAMLRALQPSWWRTTDRLRGRAYVAYAMAVDAGAFPSGPPNVQAIIKGKKVYDPRDDSTQPGGSGSQRADDPDTWTYSDNWALCTTDFERSEYGPRRDAVLKQAYRYALPALTHWESVIAAANTADETVDTGESGVTEPRYRLQGQATTADEPITVLGEMVQAGGGWYVYQGGQFRLYAGAYVAPTIPFDETMITGPVTYRRWRPRQQLFNGVRGAFRSEEHDWRAIAYSEVVSAAAVAEDGGEPIFRDYDCNWIGSQWQCQRVASILLNRNRVQRSLSCPWNLNALRVAAGETILVDYAVRDLSAQPMLIERWTLGDDGNGAPALLMELAEDSADIYDPPPLVGVPPPEEAEAVNQSGKAPGAIESLSATGGAQKITLTWDPAPSHDSVRYFEVYVANTQAANTSTGTVLGHATLLATVFSVGYIHTDLSNGSTRWYYVRAVDRFGNPGPFAEDSATAGALVADSVNSG